MSKKNSYLSPQNCYRNKIVFQQYNTNFPNLEKEIFKLINYLRINPEKYFHEFNNYFQHEEIEAIQKEINELEGKLYPFTTKKEISNAGNDFLDYLIDNTSYKLDFNFKNIDKSCFNLRARLSKYGQRYGTIFESVIINSNCAEEIVNKLIKDQKARKMLLSPNMKFIAITSGFIPKWNNICTIIDIVQNFIAYKDIDNISYNNNEIQIINTLEFDENENTENKSQNKESKQINIINKEIKNKYCSKTCKLKNSSNKKENIFIVTDNNFYRNNKSKISTENIEKLSTNSNIETKKNYNYIISRNDYSKKFNSTTSAKSKLVSPLVTYKSDAHLIFNQTHSNLQKSFFSFKRINSEIFNNNNECDLTTKTQITMEGDNYKKKYLSNYNIFSNTNKNYNNKTFNKIEVGLKSPKYKYSTERIKGKEKIEIIHSLNQIKNKLIKEKEKKSNDNKKKLKNNIDNKARITNFTLKNTDLEKNNSQNNDNKDISKTDIEKIDINYDNNNYNISFDNNTYSFFSKENQNNQNTINDNDNLLLTLDHINNSGVVNQNKKQNSFFSHDTDINNILYQKEKNINQNQLKANKINNQEKEIKNKNETDYESISFKRDNVINNNIKITENLSNNEEENIIENNIDDCDYDIEDFYYHKNKKEIKQLIRLYNKERYEQKTKIKINNIIINNINSEVNNKVNDENNKKSTATFFYIKKESNKDNIFPNNNKEDDKKIKVYRKQKVRGSNSQNKNIIINNNNNIYSNYSYKNIKAKKYYLSKNILNTDTNYYKSDNYNNLIITDNNKIIINNNYNIDKDKKRIYSYKANRAKLLKNRSCGNVLIDNKYKNMKEKQYLSDKNINAQEVKLVKSPKYIIKRVSNGYDNTETNVNRDNNNENIDEIIKLNGYKCNKKDLKKIKINYIYNNRNNYNINKGNTIYKKNIIKAENKNSLNFYNKNLKLCEKNNKYKINNNQISHINNSKKKYIIPYTNNADLNKNKK